MPISKAQRIKRSAVALLHVRYTPRHSHGEHGTNPVNQNCDCRHVLINRPISVYRLGEKPIQSCGQRVSAPRGKAGARLNAQRELRTKRQRSARSDISKSAY